MEKTTLQATTKTQVRVLLVEDDRRLAALTKEYLESHEISVVTVTTGEDALDVAARTSFDVVLLDIMLPGKDGIEICRRLRERSDVAIIMVSARGEEADRVMGLEIGADDYVPKPFASRELLARIRANVRLQRRLTKPRSDQVIEAGPLRISLASHSATLRGEPLVLTAYEFALLRVLAEHAGRVLSREQLLELTKGSADEVFDRSIDVRISRIRQKLGDDASHPTLLRTIRGAGYVLVVDPRAPGDSP